MPHPPEMKGSWNDIKWIFEQDGSLRDIYVQDVSLKEWEELIDFLNSEFRLSYSGEDQIDKKYILKYLQDTSGKMESKSLTIDLGSIKVNGYFFLIEQIEFDIDPKEINSIHDFEKLEDFMTSISELLQAQITLTAESNPEFPLFKIDVKNKINIILTEREAEELIGPRNAAAHQLSSLVTRLKIKFFPERFKKRLIESANQQYKPTKKEDNKW